MSDVVIEVNRGMVTGVYADTNLRFVIVDWDLTQRLEPGVSLGSVIERESISRLPETTRAEYIKAISNPLL